MMLTSTKTDVDCQWALNDSELFWMEFKTNEDLLEFANHFQRGVNIAQAKYEAELEALFSVATRAVPSHTEAMDANGN